MNRFQKKILVIAAGLANVGLALSAAAVATYAWFAVNATAQILTDEVSAAISTTEPDAQLTYEILKYDDNVKAGVSSTNPNDFYLPDYDSYITERNVYANAIIRAEIFTPVDTDAEEFVVDVSRLASAFKNNGAVQSYTSNVIQFKATIYSYKLVGSESYTHNSASFDNIDETSAATKYATASAYFASRETPTTFVQIRDNSDGTSVITRKSEADTITLVPSLPSGLDIASCIIYIECSYHQKLVDEYISTNGTVDLTHHALSGDISSIMFNHRTKTTNSSNATGRYVKVQSSALAATGSYLPTYEYSSLQGKILDGEKASTDITESGSAEINSSGNYKSVNINSSSGNIPQSIDSTDDIDASAFDYLRASGTLQASTGKFIGHGGTNNNGIRVNSDPTGLGNNISFSNGQASVTAQADAARKLQFNKASNGDKFAYYTSAQQNIDLYRYSENVSEIPTVSSISVNSTNAVKTFYTNHTFEITGLVVTATYSDGSTADVTGSCTFTSPSGVSPLVPGTTVFTSAENNKEVYINYTEGSFSSTTNHYQIQVIAEAITSLTVTGSLTTTYYYVNDTFSKAGVTVWGHYNSGIADVNVTDLATFGGFSNMASAGDFTVTASYEGQSVNVGTIHVVARYLSINKNTLSISEGTSDTITVTYNNNVTITQTSSNGGSVTLSQTSIAYSGSNKANQTKTITVTGASAGTVTVTFASNGVTSKICTVTVTAVPKDHFTISSGDIVSGTTYKAHSISGYDIGNSRTANWIITYGGNNSSVGTNSNNRGSCNLSSYSKYAVSPVTTSSTASAFASTTSLNKIQKISFKYTGPGSNPSSKVYAIYSADNSTFSQVALANGSFAQGGTMNSQNTEYSFTFTEAKTGYFALVFVANNNSGNWRIDDVEVSFNPVTLSSISLTGDLSTKAYQDGATISDFTGLVVTATFDDSSSEVLDHSNVAFTTSPATLSVSTTSVTVTASVTINGVTKTSSKTISGITVSAVLISSITLNTSSTSVSVGNTVTLTATISPSNATNKTLTWSSSNTGRATVNNGVVTGVAAGTVTITAAATDGSGKSATCTVTVTSSSTTTELDFSLTSNPGGWPTTNSTTLTDYTYTLNNVTYTFKLKNVKQNSGYLMCTSTAVLGLPAISGKKLTKVVAYNSSGCSTSTRVGISTSSSSANYVSGGSYQTWSTTSSSYTYNLTGTSNNTVYYLYVTNRNAQITRLVLTYSS
ncbi:Ig-like domain-containing protein [Pseudobutyrivibrio sp.]